VGSAGAVAAGSKAGSTSPASGSAVGVRFVPAGGAVPHEEISKAPKINSEQLNNKFDLIYFILA
jgi:hypothetical protein